MRLCPFLLAAALVGWFAAPALAVDLTQIERKLAKEPAYQHTPQYCLLVFGPEAKTRVWLVLDGNTLYVDRNGNGDLTEQGEKVVKSKDPVSGAVGFIVGDIVDGPRTHKGLHLMTRDLTDLANQNVDIANLLSKNPNSVGFMLHMEVESTIGKQPAKRVTQLVGVSDVNGVLQFSAKPATAPIIHFGGPLQISLYAKQQLTLGRDTELYLDFGTPGLGAGTTAFACFEGLIPEQVHPKVEITFPPKQPGVPDHQLGDRGLLPGALATDFTDR